jgi:hypothetical protein
VCNIRDGAYGVDNRKIRRNDTEEILSLLKKLGLNIAAPIARGFKNEKESVRSIYKTLDGNWTYLLDVLLLRPDEEVSP